MTTELRENVGRSSAAEYPGSAMRRILVSCAVLAVLVLPAAATARARGAAKPGYLVVSKAVGDGGVHGAPIVTLIVKGLRARPCREGGAGQDRPAAVRRVPAVRGRRWWGGRVVDCDQVPRPVQRQGIQRQQVPLPCAGRPLPGSGARLGCVPLRGRAGERQGPRLPVYPHADGRYSVDGGAWRSLPKKPVTRKIGGG
jgi:hypothetical protein